MAKPKQSNSQNKTQEKRGGIIGFFESIRDFFKNLWEKITMAMEFNKRVEDGKKYWDSSPEGQAQRETQEMNEHFGFHSRDEWEQSAEHFFGYYEMQMNESGLLRIPEKTELIWHHVSPEADAQRYLTAMEERFSERPDPLASNDGRAFTEIQSDMFVAAKRGDTSLHQFVLGKTHIAAQVQDGKINLSVSDGVTTKPMLGLSPEKVADAMMTSYTEICAKGQRGIYINTQNNTKSVCEPGPNGYTTATAKTVTGYKGVGENQTKYNMPNVIEITNAGRVSLKLANEMMATQKGEATPEDLKAVIKRAVQQAERSQGDSSAYIIGKNIVYASHHDGKTTITITQHRAAEQDKVTPVTFALDGKVKLAPEFKREGEQDKVFLSTKDGKPKYDVITRAVQQGIHTIGTEVEAKHARAQEANNLHANFVPQPSADTQQWHQQMVEFANGLHPDIKAMPHLAQAVQDGLGHNQFNGYEGNVIICKTADQTLVMTGYTHLNEQGETVTDTKIDFSGRCLYHVEAVRDEDGTIKLEQRGICDSPEKAFEYVAQRTQGQEWTRSRMELPSESLVKLPAELRERLPIEYREQIRTHEDLQRFQSIEKHPSLSSLESLVNEAQSGLGHTHPNGAPAHVVTLKSPEHTIEIRGVMWEPHYEEFAPGVSITLDGKMLYEDDSRSDGQYHKVTSPNGSFENVDAALAHIREVCGDAQWTRENVDMPGDAGEHDLPVSDTHENPGLE